MKTSRVCSMLLVTLFTAACSGGDGGPDITDPDPDPKQPVNPTPTASVSAGANSDVFSPGTVDITAGGYVTWSFGARAHDVVFGATAGAPANIPVTTNALVTRTFNTKGTFNYDCTLHSGMTGTVRVH